MLASKSEVAYLNDVLAEEVVECSTCGEIPEVSLHVSLDVPTYWTVRCQCEEPTYYGKLNRMDDGQSVLKRWNKTNA